MINDPLKQLMMDRSLGEQATMGPSAVAQQPTMMGVGFGGGVNKSYGGGIFKGGNPGPFMPKPWEGIDTKPNKPWIDKVPSQPWAGIDQPEAPVLPKPPMWEPP